MSSNLDELFAALSLPPSHLSPQRLPGANLESIAALQDVLKDNHKRHHIFFNHTRFHNHVSHRALALYALGGPAAIIRDYYKRDSQIQRPAFESPGPITEENFVDHLEDENYYQAYVTFFSKQITEKGAASTIEEFIFSEKYNFQDGKHADTQPEMLARFMAALFHPMIHVGYGVEFGLKGILVEGLAQTAVHDAHVAGLLPPSHFTSYLSSGVDQVSKHLSSFPLNFLGAANIPAASKSGGVHVFDIAARILKDGRFNIKAPTNFIEQYKGLIIQYYPMIREHTEKWSIDLNQPGEIERKMEELVWLSALLYGVGGLRSNGFRADFLLAHMVTSSLFLPSLFAYLSSRSQVLLLRAYLAVVLSWWVLRGLPTLDIKFFMATTSLEPSVPTSPAARTPVTSETTPTPNPFLPILQSAIAHPEDHLIKVQRTLAHYDTLYGTRPAGYFTGTELEGAELLDGSLFLRNALLTMDYVGWVREGQEPRAFSQEGFFM